MSQGGKDSSLMLLQTVAKSPAGPEVIFHLTFDKCSAETNNNSTQFVGYADKPKHNNSA